MAHLSWKGPVVCVGLLQVLVDSVPVAGVCERQHVGMFRTAQEATAASSCCGGRGVRVQLLRASVCGAAA